MLDGIDDRIEHLARLPRHQHLHDAREQQRGDLRMLGAPGCQVHDHAGRVLTGHRGVRLDPWRTVLGWLTLAFVLVGFSVDPIIPPS